MISKINVKFKKIKKLKTQVIYNLNISYFYI